jgi:branched-chain amino acid transport system permease protein
MSPSARPVGAARRALGSRRARRIGALVIVVAAVALVAVVPLSATPYTNLQLSLVAVYGVAVLGLNLVTGYAGQISLGQSAFFGLGGYTAAIATVRGGWPLPASFLLACALPAAVGGLLAIPAVRLRGHALAILTLALPLIAVPLAKRYVGLTGGSEGLTAPMGQAPAWSGLDNDQWTFYVVAVLAAALFLLARNAVSGRLGRALSVIRQNEVVATSMGVSTRRYKALAFAMAAGFGGAAGWLYVYTIDFISPVELDLILSVNLLSVMIAGGMGSVLGSLLGGVLYVYIPVVAGTVSPARSALLYGAILLLVIFFAPGGLARAIRRIGERLGRALWGLGPGPPGPAAAATESEGNVPAMR